MPIAVGYQSGSHYSTIQALEQYMPADKINLSYADGMLFHRLDQLIDGKAQASALFSGPYYFAEQLGFRKIIDTTFMIATMVTGDPDPEDLRKFFRALERAQRDIDLRPDLYTHYYKNEFPARYHAMMDTRRWGPGERLVFEPYTKEVYEETFKWIADHGIFADSGMGTGNYEEAVIRAAVRPPYGIAARSSSARGARRAGLQGRDARVCDRVTMPRAKCAFNPRRFRSTRGPAAAQRACSPDVTGRLAARAFSASFSHRRPKFAALGGDVGRACQLGAPRTFRSLGLAISCI